jgi:hypothetical protein
VRLGHNTILQLSWSPINPHERGSGSDPGCSSGNIML